MSMGWVEHMLRSWYYFVRSSKQTEDAWTSCMALNDLSSRKIVLEIRKESSVVPVFFREKSNCFSLIFNEIATVRNVFPLSHYFSCTVSSSSSTLPVEVKLTCSCLYLCLNLIVPCCFCAYCSIFSSSLKCPPEPSLTTLVLTLPPSPLRHMCTFHVPKRLCPALQGLAQLPSLLWHVFWSDWTSWVRLFWQNTPYFI